MVGVLAALGLVVVASHAAGAGSHPSRPTGAASGATSGTREPAPTTSVITATTVAQSATAAAAAAAAGPEPAAASAPPPAPTVAQLAGCPVPPHPPGPPAPPPWHPATLVPNSALPPVQAPAPWRSDLQPITGTGMWIWQWSQTDNGDAAAIVQQAVRAGLHQLWVRVGDSENGFYGGPELAALVPPAHAAGLSVIAWGFPYLYDPVGDARWTAQILAWRSPSGEAIDGYSADIERPTEGVDLTAQRVAVYLGLVRRAAGNRLVVATVYPPIDAYWFGGEYPFAAIAPYVDAFAPMIYWECTDPGSDAAVDIARLSALRPVHIIGQAYNMASVGGRAVSPSGAEITEFLSAGRRAGAVGASLWAWQTATPAEWAALAAYRW